MKEFENWLITIANTRFVFNTIQELETFMDNHSIQSNGIKKAYPTPQKQRAAFRDLQIEVLEMTNSQMDLENVLIDYKQASLFYKVNLIRKKNPKLFALDLLRYLYRTTCEVSNSVRTQELINQIIQEDINVPILILLLIKVLPSYDSKEGDVKNITANFTEMLALLNDFMKDNTTFSIIPSILLAHKEKNKCRLTMILHAANIISTYNMFENNDHLYERVSEFKQSRSSLDFEGYWNECNGTMNSTNFWYFEPTIEEGVFFATHWEKTSENILIPARYTVAFNETEDGGMIMYMLHPKAMMNRVNRKPLSDMDHTWYTCEIPNEESLDEFYLERLLPSSAWAASFHLTRVRDSKIIDIYENWIQKKCKIKNPFKEFEYSFYFQLYAITQTDLYIEEEEDGHRIFYKVPKEVHNGLETIHIDDNVGILTIGDKKFLGFDEIMLYIEISDDQLSKYGIKKVVQIE